LDQSISFNSDGLKLSGVLSKPDILAEGELRPAIILLHGFGVSKNMADYIRCSDLLMELGYICLRFDFRGCGDSEGQPARVICLEQVDDIRNAVTYIMGQPSVDTNKIGVLGHSFGAAVAVYAGGIDKRISGVISSCGWGNGETKFQQQHSSPKAWARFENMLMEGKRHFEESGNSLMFDRWDIVPIPQSLRGNLTGDVIMSFPYETVQSMFDFRANDVVGLIAPRPLLLLHASNDSVTPTEQSIDLFNHAGQPTDLVLLSDMDHFPLEKSDSRARHILKDWLDRYLPV